MFYGYGICASDLGVTSTERIEKLLAYAPEYREEIHDYFKREGILNPTVQNYLDSNIKEDYDFATMLKKFIAEAMDIHFTTCQSDDNEKNYLIY